MKNGILLLGASLALLLVSAAFVLEAPVASATGEEVVQAQREYIGATRCRMCHRTEEQGQQYDKWLEGPHAKAYESLASDEAKAIAAERGIADPQKAEECLKCHVTAYNVPAEFLGSKYAVEEGVSCESCHGPGGDYYKKSTMEAITAGEMDGAEVGLVKPNEQLCRGCHNEESPVFKGFNFDEMYAKIAHTRP